jgi:hypothetical protein
MTCRHNPKASRLSRCAMGSRDADWEECLGRLGRRPRPTRNEAPPRRRDMCAQEVAMEVKCGKTIGEEALRGAD